MIVVAGEALFDVFTREATPTGLALDARIGGSPFNVAVGLARLRQPVAFLGSVDRGPLGERLVQALANEGVDISRIERVFAPTTLSLIALNAAGVPEYAFYGSDAADRQLSLAALDALPTATRAIHVGSYATVVEPIATTLATLVDREYLRRLISYDPNIRLNVEPDTAVWRQKLEWMLPRTHLLKISEEDISLLYPGADPAELAQRWLKAGAVIVVVTRGQNGAIGWCAEGVVDLPAPRVEVIDTVGAGDTFQCAMLAWLAEHDNLTPAGARSLGREALGSAMRFAIAAAAATCSRRGADMPRRDELRV